MVSAASITVTDRPFLANVTAAASPFGPDPMTIASTTTECSHGSPLEYRLCPRFVPARRGGHSREGGDTAAVRFHCVSRSRSTPSVAVVTSATTKSEVAGSRISNLDLLRGVAVLGILVMNAVSYGLPEAAYFNLDAAGSESRVDWFVGGLNEIFVDQKMMGLFSMLFGASIVLFCE